MKIFLTLFVLFFSFGCERNYINDYKIEGIGLEDSLLDFFSEAVIFQAIKVIFLPTNASTSGPLFSGGLGPHPITQTNAANRATCLTT